MFTTVNNKICSYLVWSPVIVKTLLVFQRYWVNNTGKSETFLARRTLNPFRTAVPFWGQTTRNMTLSPKRDYCTSKRVKTHPKTTDILFVYNTEVPVILVYAAVDREHYRKKP